MTNKTHQSVSLSPRLQGFLDKVSTAADKSNAMKHLSKWMTKNLRLNGRPYTFKHHEMQEAIAADQHPHKVVTKCSQVGLTELSLRIVAAIAGVTRSRIIYILPSARFSEKVSTDRFLPIVKESPILSNMIHAEAKSAAMRKLGNSTIYFQGASGTSQAISIPATHLIIDEENFCDPTILGQFNSRIRHAEEDPITGIRGFRQRFSTPTVPNYGVSKHYEMSDKRGYQVKCHHCNTWQLPDFYKDYVIPNYDGEIALFDATDLANKHYKVDEAYVKCNHCGKDLWEDLMNPQQRQWVAERPDVIDLRGYQVAPIDVPYYNKVPSLFKQLEGYTTQDHRNFVMGLPYEDKNNSFLESIFSSVIRCSLVPLVEASRLTLSGIRMGVDVGKTSHVSVIKRVSSKQVDVLYVGTVTAEPSHPLHEQIQRFIDAFKPDVVVVDAGPDFTTSQTLVDNNSYGRVYGCEYRRSVTEAFSTIEVKDDVGIVKADRSGTLSEFMEMHNKGEIRYPSHPETDVVKEHLKVTKKVKRMTEFGEVSNFPKPSEPDHYCHSLNYALIADKIASKEVSDGKGVVGVVPSVTGVKLKGEEGEDLSLDFFALLDKRNKLNY